MGFYYLAEIVFMSCKHTKQPSNHPRRLFIKMK